MSRTHTEASRNAGARLTGADDAHGRRGNRLLRSSADRRLARTRSGAKLAAVTGERSAGPPVPSGNGDATVTERGNQGNRHRQQKKRSESKVTAGVTLAAWVPALAKVEPTPLHHHAQETGHGDPFRWRPGRVL